MLLLTKETLQKYLSEICSCQALEEHPFTILESKDFQFRIQLMESETTKADSGLNAGFFDRKGNRCRILSPKEDSF